MSLCCFRRRDWKQERLETVELEVVRLRTELECLTRSVRRRACSIARPTLPQILPETSPTTNIAPTITSSVAPVTPHHSSSSSSSASFLAPPTAPPFTAAMFSPFVLSKTVIPSSSSTSTSFPSSSSSTFALAVPAPPAPPTAPPLTPFPRPYEQQPVESIPFILSTTSPDGHISTASLTAALDSIVAKKKKNNPPPPPSSSSSSSSASINSSTVVRTSPRQLRPRPANSANTLAPAPSGFTEKGKSSRKQLRVNSVGVSVDALLGVKLRKPALKSGKRGRPPNSPSNKENVDNFLKAALEKKFKRQREHEQEELTDTEWTIKKTKRPLQTLSPI